MKKKLLIIPMMFTLIAMVFVGVYCLTPLNYNLSGHITYNPELYTLNYDASGGTVNGSGTSTETIIYGSTVTLPTPVRDAYNFDGWWISSSSVVSNMSISSAQEFVDFVSGVNNGSITTEGATFTLTADIDLTGFSSCRIYNFKGTFDGCGHSISNISDVIGGLFYILDGATIKNLSIKGSLNIAADGGDFGRIGGICTSANNSLFINCYNESTINCSIVYSSNLGGLCGQAINSSFINCYNSGSIVCANTGEYDAINNLGGICAYSDGSTFTNCFNTTALHAIETKDTKNNLVYGNVSSIACESATLNSCYDLASNNNIGNIQNPPTSLASVSEIYSNFISNLSSSEAPNWNSSTTPPTLNIAEVENTKIGNAGEQITYNYRSSKTFIARWIAKSYTITYSLAGGNVSSANKTNYTIETPTFTLNNPTRTGYTFAGWTGSNGTTKQTTVTISKGTTGNLNYTANWTPVTYSISYTLNSGSVSGNPSSYNIETTTFTLNNPTRTGYTFAGWTGSNGTTKQTTVTISKGSTGNRSYTANWTVNKYNLTLGFRVNGSSASIPSGFTVDFVVGGTTNSKITSYNQSVNYGSTYKISKVYYNGTAVSNGGSINNYLVSYSTSSYTLGTSAASIYVSFTSISGLSVNPNGGSFEPNLMYNYKTGDIATYNNYGTIHYDTATDKFTFGGTNNNDAFALGVAEMDLVAGTTYTVSFTSLSRVRIFIMNNKENTSGVIKEFGLQYASAGPQTFEAPSTGKAYLRIGPWYCNGSDSFFVQGLKITSTTTTTTTKISSDSITNYVATTPTRSGYTFAGWQVVNGSASGNFITGGTNTTLCATWKTSSGSLVVNSIDNKQNNLLDNENNEQYMQNIQNADIFVENNKNSETLSPVMFVNNIDCLNSKKH